MGDRTLVDNFSIKNLEALFRQYKDVVYKTTYLMSGDAHRAEGILEDVAIGTDKSLDASDPEGELFRWILRPS